MSDEELLAKADKYVRDSSDPYYTFDSVGLLGLLHEVIAVDATADGANQALSTPQGWAEAISYLETVRKEMKGLYEDWPAPDGDPHKDRIGDIVAQINMLLPEAEARRLATR